MNLYSSNAFLGDEFSLNMYENIDEWINDLENTIYKKQLKTSRSWNIVNIEDRVSELTNIEWIAECYIEANTLTSTDIENIWNGRIDKIFESISEDCKINDSIGIDFFLNNYYNTISELDQESRRIAEEQSRVISEIARVWIYSDGNDQNSPFDLIVDLQNINNIVFSTEIPFAWVNSENNNEILECLAEKFSAISDDIVGSITQSIETRDSAYQECENFSSSQNFGETFELEWLSEGIAWWQNWDEAIDFFWTASDGNNLVCQDSSVHSWLSPEAITQLIETTWEGRETTAISTFLPEIIIDEDGNEIEVEAPDYPQSEYKKVSDDSIWPCTEYFCIRTDFVTKNYDLLTWWRTNSIEAIIERSNGHLKIAANSLLVQSKVTTNNFEMWWRDLSLPDMFHAWVQVQFSPPPILNLSQVGWDNEKDSQEFWDDFALDNLLHSYFEEANLDYLKQNDLEKFKQVEIDRKTTLAGQNLTIDRILESSSEIRQIINWYETEVTRSILDKKVNNEDISDLDAQFAEIERFSNSIKDYSIATSAIIQKLKEIPIFTNW